MKLKNKLLFVSIIIISLVFNLKNVEAKELIYNTLAPDLNYYWNCYGNCVLLNNYWITYLKGINIQLNNYRVTLIRSDGSIIKENDKLQPGEIITLNISTPCNLDGKISEAISWFGTGYGMDSPYGACVNNFPTEHIWNTVWFDAKPFKFSTESVSYNTTSTTTIQIGTTTKTIVKTSVSTTNYTNNVALLLKTISYSLDAKFLQLVPGTTNKYKVISSGIDANGNCNLNVNFSPTQGRFYYSFLTDKAETRSYKSFLKSSKGYSEYTLDIPSFNISYTFKCNRPPQIFLR